MPGDADGGPSRTEEKQVGKQPDPMLEVVQQKTGTPDVISPEDLERVRMVIDGLKKQYGPGWDSSKIEADLKLMLERQTTTASGVDSVKSPMNQR